LDYVASFFNLVYTNNPASVNLWRSLNFTQIGMSRMPHFAISCFVYYLKKKLCHFMMLI
jgi:hypothetical protein